MLKIEWILHFFSICHISTKLKVLKFCIAQMSALESQLLKTKADEWESLLVYTQNQFYYILTCNGLNIQPSSMSIRNQHGEDPQFRTYSSKLQVLLAFEFQLKWLGTSQVSYFTHSDFKVKISSCSSTISTISRPIAKHDHHFPQP